MPAVTRSGVCQPGCPTVSECATPAPHLLRLKQIESDRERVSAFAPLLHDMLHCLHILTWPPCIDAVVAFVDAAAAAREQVEDEELDGSRYWDAALDDFDEGDEDEEEEWGEDGDDDDRADSDGLGGDTYGEGDEDVEVEGAGVATHAWSHRVCVCA